MVVNAKGRGKGGNDRVAVGIRLGVEAGGSHTDRDLEERALVEYTDAGNAVAGDMDR